MLKTKIFHDEKTLIEHIQTHKPSFYYSSQTSTVIPYDKLSEIFKEEDYYLCDLSKLPSHFELTKNNTLIVRGPLTWKDARIFLRSKGRDIMTSPTEELALVTAGAATSCTGERCFGYGNLRSQIKRIKYINYQGREIELHSDKDLKLDIDDIEKYNKDFQNFKNYKNAPFPRFEKETDLMIGTEGQLGVITEIEIDTVALGVVHYFFILLPKWEENIEPHMEIYKKVQNFRDDIVSCELVDSNAFSYLKDDEKLGKDNDVIFLEVKGESFEKVFEQFLSNLEKISENDIFEISEEQFHHVRASVPRAIFEANSKAGVVKMGTDVQVDEDHFDDLLKYYREGAKVGIKYNLFGHFGDAHLHFNFMPTPDKLDPCYEYFQSLYDKVVEWKGSPFAEHGIGIIKQKYIENFWNTNQPIVFKGLKRIYDPKSQFFPQGFMSLSKS